MTSILLLLGIRKKKENSKTSPAFLCICSLTHSCARSDTQGAGTTKCRADAVQTCHGSSDGSHSRFFYLRHTKKRAVGFAGSLAFTVEGVTFAAQEVVAAVNCQAIPAKCLIVLCCLSFSQIVHCAVGESFPSSLCHFTCSCTLVPLGSQ